MTQYQSPAEDEINLAELLKKLKNNRGIIIWSTAALTLLAGGYAFLKTPVYDYSACVSMGITGVTDQGQPVYTQSPQSAIAAISAAYLPNAIHDFNKSHSVVKYDSKDFHVTNPEDSPLVCLETQGSKDEENDIASIINAAASDIIAHDSKISAVSQSNIQANINNLYASREELQSKLKSIINQEDAVKQEIKLMESKKAITSTETAALEKQVGHTEGALTAATKEARGSGSAIAMIIQNNELSNLQQRLYHLRLEQAVDLPKQETALNNQLKSLRRQFGNITAQLKTNQSQLDSAKASLVALQKTVLLRPVERSTLPAGPGKGVIILLGAFLGFFLGILYVLARSAFTYDSQL